MTEIDLSQNSVNELKEMVIKGVHSGTLITAAKKELENRSIYLTKDETNLIARKKKERIYEAKKKEKSIKDYWNGYYELYKDDRKLIHFTILSVLLTLVGLVIKVNRLEDGSIDTIGMYVFVFLIPILIISSLNTLLLLFASKFKKIIMKRLISVFPLFLLVLLSQFKRLELPYLDANLSSICTICTITIGITNLLWGIMISLKIKSIK